MPSFRLVIDETSGLTRLREVPPEGLLSRNGTLRRALTGTAVAAITLAVLALAALAGLAWTDARLDSESAAVARSALKAIATDWDPKALAARSTPDLVAAAPDRIAAQFDRLSRFGDARIGVCRGGSRLEFQGRAAPRAAALYDCDLDFQAGPAEADIALRYAGGAWRISGFRVNSPLLGN
jgi:hypothetical protein